MHPHKYYYSPDGSAVIGPQMLDKLREYYRNGALPQATQICREGDHEWHPLSDFIVALPSAPQIKQEWYYSQNGRRIGPINEIEIRKLISEHKIHPDTQVWCEGMADWKCAQQTSLKTFFEIIVTPPPLKGENVNNGIVWTIAFVPIIAAILQAFFAASYGHSRLDFWWIAPLLNSGLCLADEQKLKNAGQNTNGMTVWALLLVPVYLFVRASRLKQNNSYAIVWLATFFISLFL